MREGSDRRTYLEILHIDHADAVRAVADLASSLTGEEHTIRSSIIDLHFAIEVEVKRLLYHALRGTLLFGDEADRNKKAKVLSDAVDRLPMGSALNLLEATIRHSPWPDLESVWEINKTRNKLSHRPRLEEVTYKGRNPFTDTDCLAQMYFDVWASQKCFAKLFERVIEEPLAMLWFHRDEAEVYRKKFGDLTDDELPQLREYPEW